MKGKTERDGWTECGREKREEKENRKKLRYVEINGKRREEECVCACVLHGVNHGCWLMDGSRF